MATNLTQNVVKTIMFDVDGTIADTERYGHLPASNAAFAELGLPIEWTWEEFKELLSLPGSVHRMRAALSKQTPMSRDEIEALLPQLTQLKQRIYIEDFLPNLTLRPGVGLIVAQAVEHGLRLAIVSTSYEAQIHALLKTLLPEQYAHFHPILGKESGKKTGQTGRLYEKCLELLKCDPAEVLVIEDSEVGLVAAKRADLRCAVFYNDYTFGQNFAGAELVAKSLEFFDLELLLKLCSPS